MTYNVFGGMLNLALSTYPKLWNTLGHDTDTESVL